MTYVYWSEHYCHCLTFNSLINCWPLSMWACKLQFMFIKMMVLMTAHSITRLVWWACATKLKIHADQGIWKKRKWSWHKSHFTVQVKQMNENDYVKCTLSKNATIVSAAQRSCKLQIYARCSLCCVVAWCTFVGIYRGLVESVDLIGSAVINQSFTGNARAYFINLGFKIAWLFLQFFSYVR